MKTKIWLVGIMLFTSCSIKQSDNNPISKKEMLQIVKEHDNQFRLGVQKKDSTLLINLYTDSAQYLQPNRSIITGKRKIGKDWGSFFRMKENPIDLVTSVNDVRGNREIIYETGQAYTLLADSTKWNFHYVNIWRLQKDGSYKLDVDVLIPLDK